MTQDLFNQSFFNTTSESKEVVKKKIDVNAKQNEVILQKFKDFPNTLFTGSDLYNLTHGSILLTSIRRGLNTLCRAGQIEHIDKRYNKFTQANEFTYKLK